MSGTTGRRKLYFLPLVMSMLLWPATPAQAQISVGVQLPRIHIGINVPTYPNLVRVQGSPVYYDPRARSNYFFYDGLYWVYSNDEWYASSWYNGPWEEVGPEAVPLYVLRVPVRYYRRPPAYFHGWAVSAPPRWGEHWGRGWEDQRRGWDQWDRRSVPGPAPLPVYQRRYSGRRYPSEAQQQRAIRSERYQYRPREPITQQHYSAPGHQYDAEQQDRGHRQSGPPHDNGKKHKKDKKDKGDEDHN